MGFFFSGGLGARMAQRLPIGFGACKSVRTGERLRLWRGKSEGGQVFERKRERFDGGGK